MKFELMLRARPPAVEPIEEKHARFMSMLRTVGDGWGLKDDIAVAAPHLGSNLAADINLSRAFQKGMRARVSYRLRRADAPDDAFYDDYFFLEYDPIKFDTSLLVRKYLLRLVQSFGAYLGRIGDVMFYEKDFELNRNTNARSQVTRIYPVNFFDEELCARAFGLSPMAIASRVRESVEKAEVVGSGLLLIADSGPISFRDAVAVDQLIRLLVGSKS